MTKYIHPMMKMRAVGIARRFVASRFGRNITRVISASLVVQALSMLAAPLVTRLFPVEAFAAGNVFTSLTVILLSLTIGRVDLSIPNVRTHGAAAGLFLVGGMLLFGFVGVVVALCLLPGAWFDIGDLGAYAWPHRWLLPLRVFAAGAQSLLQSWHVRNADLAVTSRARIVQGVTGVGTNLLFGFAGTGTLGYLFGTLLAGSSALPPLLWRTAGLWRAVRRLTRRRIAVIVRRYAFDSAWSTAASFVNVLGLSGIAIVLAAAYSKEEMGGYALATRLALVPINILSVAVAQAFWAEAAVLKRESLRLLRALFLRSTIRMFIISLPIIAVCVAAPSYFGVLFGANWGSAGWILAALTPMLFGQIVVSPLSHLAVHRRQRWQFALDLTRLIVAGGTAWVMSLSGFRIESTVFVISLFILGIYGVAFALNLWCLQQRE